MYGQILTIGSQRQLFIDDWIVEDTWCAPRVIHEPERWGQNPILAGGDWDVNLVAPEVRQGADGSWQMWYTGHRYSAREQVGAGRGRSEYRIGYAVSEDGLHWRRPNLGLVTYRGSADNNIVLDTNHVTAEGQWLTMNRAHCLGPQGLFLVDGAGPANDDGLLHATTKTGIPELVEEHPKGGICHLVSEDGLQWRRASQRYLMIYGHSDCMNHVVWSPELKRYLCFMRPPIFAGPGKRRMAVSQSQDMVEWTQPVVVLTQDEADPAHRDFDRCRVFRYEGMWLCFLATYDHQTWANPMQVELIHSRDGLTWHRFPQRSFIFTCGRPGAFDEGWAVTTTRPLLVDGRLRVYYDGLGFHPAGPGAEGPSQTQEIGVASWRRDGFVSRRHVPLPDPRYVFEPGQILTRAFRCEGRQLFINACRRPHAADGDIRVEVLQVDTASGDHLRSVATAPGYACGDCVPFRGDDTDAAVTWKGDHCLERFLGKVIRLKFYLDASEIYAFQLRG